MRVIRWGSVRTRMTLWNVAVLALILGILGAVVRYTVKARLFAAVDQILQDRARPVVLWLRVPPPGTDPKREKLLGFAFQRDALPNLPGTSPPFPPFVSGEGGPPAEDILRTRVGAETKNPYLPRMILKTGKPPSPEPPWDPKTCALSMEGDEVYSTIRISGETLRVLSLPLRREDQIEGVLQLPYPMAGVDRELERLTGTLLTLAPLALLLAGVGGALLTGRALRPVRSISEAAARMGARDLSARLPVSGRDEFAELGQAFNGLLSRLEAQFSEQRRFTADASHELRTPLAIIKANTASALESDWSRERLLQAMCAIDRAADRQTRLAEALLFLARADAGHLARDVGPTSLSEVLEEARDAVTAPGRATIRLDIPVELTITGSGYELTRLFTNLLENAVRHTPFEGRITVTVSRSGGGIEVLVTDTGEGIAAEHLPHLGTRFYRGSRARSREDGGTGLGLAICRSIVEAHGGTLSIESAVEVGTVVRVLLPA